MDLPEIRTMVGHFLRNADLAACIRVCREWHQSMAPLLWKEITLSHQIHHTRDAFAKHAHLIQRLVAWTPDLLLVEPPELALSFPRLTTLQLSASVFLPQAQFGLTMDRYEDLLRNSPVLETLKVDFASKEAVLDRDMTSFWVAIKDHCPLLRSLTVNKMTFKTVQVMNCFLEVCSRLMYLTLDKVTLAYTFGIQIPACVYEHSLGHIACLRISDMRPHSLVSAFLALFDGIRSLFVTFGQGDVVSPESFAQLATVGTWPELESLSIYTTSINLSDIQLAGILESLKPCWKLSLGAGPVGPRSMEQLLGRHALTLKSLSVDDFDGEGKENYGSAFLINCPLLEILCVDFISPTQILKSPDSWKCLGLHSLLTVLAEDHRDEAEGDKTATQLALMQRLAKLTRLKTVGLDCLGQSTPPLKSWFLSLRLGQGLELLTGWTELEELTFQGVPQDMEMEDVEWMCKHWKKLQAVRGILNPDEDKQDLMEDYILDQGIDYDQGDIPEMDEY